jgi:hypothetical protein
MSGEWHGGGPRGYPKTIRVSACPRCGLRVGSPWEDCPGVEGGMPHEVGPEIVYTPKGHIPDAKEAAVRRLAAGRPYPPPTDDECRRSSETAMRLAGEGHKPDTNPPDSQSCGE